MGVPEICFAHRRINRSRSRSFKCIQCNFSLCRHVIHFYHYNSKVFKSYYYSKVVKITLTLSFHPLLHGIALQFTYCIRSDPFFSTLHLIYLMSSLDRRLVQRRIPLSYFPQRPVDRFLDEIPVVICMLFDYRQELQESFVISFLVVDSKISHQCKARPFFIFHFPACPLHSFPVSEGRICKEAARMVADAPAVKILSPFFHLFFCHMLRMIYHRRKRARFMYISLPKIDRKST